MLPLAAAQGLWVGLLVVLMLILLGLSVAKEYKDRGGRGW